MGDKPNLFEDKLFDVEHALDLYALSYAQFPANRLYDHGALESILSTIELCHIYFVGYVPSVVLIEISQEGDTLVQSFEYLGERHDLVWPMPDGGALKKCDGWYVEMPDGNRVLPSIDDAMLRLHEECHPIDFKIQYIGQAFGSDGDRNALDRLRKHETLQKISLLGAPDGYRLELILVEVEPNNKLIMVMNPFAKNVDEGPKRIAAGLDKLFGTTYKEMISLYEAAMIRYFQPHYNKIFKNSFPSTNLTVLQDSYDKDMAALVAEFCFDRVPFRRCSSTVPAREYHIAKFNLHSKKERDVFFCRST